MHLDKQENRNYRNRNRDDVRSKGSSGSLRKYQRSPYLQKIANGYSLPKKNHIPQNPSSPKTPTQLYSQKKQNLLFDHSAQTEQTQRSRSNFAIIDNQRGTKFKLPKLDNGEHHKTQKNEKLSTASLSATLETTSKKRKLIPIQSTFRMHSITKTKAGTNGKQTKINQDIGIVQTSLPHGVKLYCVCDGHGLNGHLVSAFIKQHLVKILTITLKKQPKQPQNIDKIFQECLRKTNEALLSSDINTELSGSTVIAVFIHNSQIYSYNVGDSRAIIGKQKEDDWQIVELSNDQKPSRPDEKQRIIKEGGRVQAQKNQKGQEIGPLRVWMKDIQMPGLAMTRSFGDKAGIKAGTNGEPELTKLKITAHHKFIVIASDGVWQYLQNDEVTNIIIPFYLKNDIDMAGQKIVRISTQIWQKISYSRDDITVIIVSINPPNPKQEIENI